MRDLSQRAQALIQAARKIVIVPHAHPDPDALGSASALFEYASALGRPAVIFCATPVGATVKFLPNAGLVTNDPNIWRDPNVEAVIVVDSGDLRYAGVSEYLKGHLATIINFDHHATNEYFGHLNLVSTAAAATTEIIFNFCRHNRVTITPRMATALLAGLVADTGNFTNAATSATALAAAGELIRVGGNFGLISRALIKNKNLGTLRLWGLALSRLKSAVLAEEPGHSITHTYLLKSDLIAVGASEEETEGIANFLNHLEGTDIALFLRETEDGKIKGSMRTTVPGVDVAAIAKKLGGGGHTKAAGFTVDGTASKVLEKILTAV